MSSSNNVSTNQSKNANVAWEALDDYMEDLYRKEHMYGTRRKMPKEHYEFMEYSNNVFNKAMAPYMKAIAQNRKKRLEAEKKKEVVTTPETKETK